MIWKVLLEGLGLGLILVLVCALGIRNGAVGMAHLYSEEVQKRAIERGLTTAERIKRNGLRMKCICTPVYLLYVVLCVYGINGTRGFLSCFWQALVILMLLNLTDRLLVDEFWVLHTKAWVIPGTEDLQPYITAADKKKKWLIATVSWTVIAAALAGLMQLLPR